MLLPFHPSWELSPCVCWTRSSTARSAGDFPRSQLVLLTLLFVLTLTARQSFQFILRFFFRFYLASWNCQLDPLCLSHFCISSTHYAWHILKWKCWLFSCVPLFATQWIVAPRNPPSMGFSRQEYWGGLPFPSPGDLPDPGTEPGSLALQADSLPYEPPGKPVHNIWDAQ